MATVTRTTLPDGREQLHDEKGATFTYAQLRADVLLVTITGNDTGQFGALPLEQLTQRLGETPLQLFVDTRDAEMPAPAVSEAWTAWFAGHRAQLARVTILASSRFVNLTVSVAKLFSRTGELIQIYSDPQLFEQALAAASGQPLRPGAAATPLPSPTRPTLGPQPSAGVRREVRPDGAVQLFDERCRFVYQRLRPGVLLVRIEGDDHGQFGHASLDAIKAELARYPLTLFIDARGASSAAPAVSEEWTAWFAEHRTALSRVTILTGSRVITLTIDIAKHLSRTGELIQLTSDPSRFAAEVAKVAPGFRGLD